MDAVNPYFKEELSEINEVNPFFKAELCRDGRSQSLFQTGALLGWTQSIPISKCNFLG